MTYPVRMVSECTACTYGKGVVVWFLNQSLYWGYLLWRNPHKQTDILNPNRMNIKFTRWFEEKQVIGSGKWLRLLICGQYLFNWLKLLSRSVVIHASIYAYFPESITRHVGAIRGEVNRCICNKIVFDACL